MRHTVRSLAQGTNYLTSVVIASILGTFKQVARHLLVSFELEAYAVVEIGRIPVRLGFNERAKTSNTEAIVDIVSNWAMTVPADIEAAFSTETH